MPNTKKLYLILALAAGICGAQGAPPTARTRSVVAEGAGTFVSSAEIAALLASAATGAVADNVLRVVPVDGEYNVGVSVVRRVKVAGKTPTDAVRHHDVTEVYQVLKGNGILAIGGSIEGETELPSGEAVVRNVIGPSSVGKSITGGVRQRVAAGDVVIIPANTPHGFIELTSDEITYLLVRVDPHRVLAQKAH